MVPRDALVIVILIKEMCMKYFYMYLARLGVLISFLQWGHIVYMSVKVSYWQTFILFLKIELLVRKY